jgi:BirA family biotin operon repressor/biotin-[acetyl-CoA-carboxylase] ligase
VEAHDLLVSTQDLMRERLAAGADIHGLVIRAQEQKGGRGQRKRDWHSGRGGSWQTAAVRDPGGRLARSPVTLAIAVSLCTSFAQAGVTLQVKWPNDLLTGGNKVAGILCENVQGHLLAGVGVNVYNAVPAGAATLRELPAGSKLRLEQVHELVLAGIAGGLRLAQAGAGLPAAFAAVDALAGRQVEVLQGTRMLQGTALGIDADGSLRLQAGARVAGMPGAVISVRSGRVRLLPDRAGGE